MTIYKVIEQELQKMAQRSPVRPHKQLNSYHDFNR